MKLYLSLLLTCLTVCAAEKARFYSFGYQEPEGQVAQFYSGADSAFLYNWGYQYPGQAHSESKARDGTVTGSYVYTDANGEFQQTNYIADPIRGYVVEQSNKGSVVPVGITAPVIPETAVYPAIDESIASPQFSSPQVSSFVHPAVPEPAAVTASPVPLEYSQEEYRVMAQRGVPLDVGSEQLISEASPVLLGALRAGQLVPVLGYKDQIVFRVSDALVDDNKGSVSALASFLDVDTVAPRHDQKAASRPVPSFYSGLGGAPAEEEESKVRGFLDTEYFTDGPGYVVRIPY